MDKDFFKIIDAFSMPRPKGVIQIGASSGQEIPFFISNRIEYGIFVEPLVSPFDILTLRCSAVPGFLPVKAICGSQDGREVNFYVSSNNGESSSVLEPDRHLVDYPYVSFSEKSTLTSFTADSILKAVAQSRPEIAGAIELLFMDVQGAELNVLQGASNVLQKVKFIYTEVGLGGGYKGDVHVYDLIMYLKSFGFDIYFLEIGRTGWGNAFFVRRNVGT